MNPVPKLIGRRPVLGMLLVSGAALAQAETNPCAARNPCAAKNPCNPCGACNPCAVTNPCTAKAYEAAALKVGQRAPDFELPSTTGSNIALRDYRGKKPVLLMFYSQDFNPT